MGKYEGKNLRAKLLNHSLQFLGTICWEILENYMLGNWVDTSGLLMGVSMAQYYGIILRFKLKGSSVEHPGSADLSRTMHSEASEVI